MSDDPHTPNPQDAGSDELLAPGHWGVRIATSAGPFTLSHTTVEPQTRGQLIGHAMANSRSGPEGESLSLEIRRLHRMRWHRVMPAILAACQTEVLRNPVEPAELDPEVSENARAFRLWVLGLLDQPGAPKPAGVVDLGPETIAEPCRWGLRVDTGDGEFMLSTVTRSPITAAELISSVMANTTSGPAERALSVIARDAGISWATGRALLLAQCKVQLVRHPPGVSAEQQTQQQRAFHRWARQLLLRHAAVHGGKHPEGAIAGAMMLEATVDGQVLQFTARHPLELPPEKVLEVAVMRDLAWEGQHVALACATQSVAVPDIVRYAVARFGLRVAHRAGEPIQPARRIDMALAEANRQLLARAMIEALSHWEDERALLDEPTTARCGQHPKGLRCTRCGRLQVRDGRWIEQVVEGLATGYAPESCIRAVPEQFNGAPTMWWVLGYEGHGGAKRQLRVPARTLFPGRALLGFLRNTEMGQVAAARKVPQLGVLQSLVRRTRLRVEEGPLTAAAAAVIGLPAEQRRKGQRFIGQALGQLPQRLPVDLEATRLDEFGPAGSVCLRKAVYVTEADALRHQWKRGDKNPPLRPYPCPVCGLWHLTSSDVSEAG
ncbi:hypothetical protein ACFXPX_04955 [Kitasatospora sp. NPDC059146]|uniref:hypothetical protein n=1 Tax=unclassified Kitasatospora TaxID=2633591 RepID=UPI00369C2534